MSLLNENYNWYPVYTHPRAEKKISTLLSKQKIEHFLPLVKTLKQWSDRKKWIDEPLLKSYLFVKISNKEYQQVIETKGIVKFIYFSGKIASILDSEIEMIKNYLSNEFQPEVIYHQLEKGQKVKIIEGKLKGYEAELVSWKNKKKIILRLDALGQSILLNIQAGYIEPAK